MLNVPASDSCATNRHVDRPAFLHKQIDLEEEEKTSS